MHLIASALRTLLIAGLALLAAVFAVRAWQAMQGPPLMPWHSYVPAEPSPAALDAMQWNQWLKHEDQLFAAVSAAVTDQLPDDARIPQNRYWAEAPMHPSGLRRDWNRSFTLRPDREPLGAAVMLHGLTDSPYSLRHVALHYQARGWAVVAVRLPGHGTVPAALTLATVEQWQAAARMAVREARLLAPAKPLHLVGYSNGGALALAHALDATADPRIGVPQRIVLFSPMVGLTRFARFSGLAALPAVFPAFVKAAWLDIIPEYNPFKYNSFPVHAAAEAHRLTELLGARMRVASGDGRIAGMPPVLAFQSVVDSTVSTPAVVSDLFDRLPANGSELVLVDVNRAAAVGPMLRPSAVSAAQRLSPAAPRRYRTSLIMNAAPGAPQTMLRSFAPGTTRSTEQYLGIDYRLEFFSLGHVALPFPLSDGLYGASPSPTDPQGVALGALALRGESGVLGATPTLLTRVSSNPFLPWMLGRIDLGIAADAAPIAAQ